MKVFCVWLVMVAVSLTAFSSCVNPAQELSAYWNGHDFGSLDGFDDIDAAEEKFDGYIDLLNRVPADVASEHMHAFLDSAARDTVAYMVWASWFEPYLHSPESPYRNDELFSVWLDRTLEDKVVDGHMLERLQQIKDVMCLNVIGRPAADVLLTDVEGAEYRISDFKGQRTLLMLLDANCPSCLDYLTENLKEYGRQDVRMVAVLVNGSPMHIRNVSSHLSDDIISRWLLTWCPGREIEEGRIYDLTMVPSRIMLDHKNTIEKLYY